MTGERLPEWLRSMEEEFGRHSARLTESLLQEVMKRNAVVEAWIREQFAAHLVLETRETDDEEEVYQLKCNGEYFGRPLKLKYEIVMEER